MKGKLYHEKDMWIVRWTNGTNLLKSIPQEWENEVHPDDVKELNKLVEQGENIHGKVVEFDIVDEFIHPHLFINVGWGDGRNMAKLKNTTNEQSNKVRN